jgi:hypothetical protein
VAPHQHRVGLGVVNDGLAQAVGQLALARRVLDDGDDAVAVEAVALDALGGKKYGFGFGLAKMSQVGAARQTSSWQLLV